MKEKNFRVKIVCDRPESTMFGTLTNTVINLLVSKSVKDMILKEFNGRNSVLTVVVDDSLTRYINMQNILYIDVSEVVEPVETEEV